MLYSLDRGALRVGVCCGAARGMGIRDGMPLAEARAIAGDALLARERDETAEHAALTILAADCRRYSPLCGVSEAAGDGPADGLILDVTGCGHLLGGDRPLARAAVRWLSGRGYTVRAGLGPTVGMAWAAARLRRARDAPSKDAPSKDAPGDDAPGDDALCEVPASRAGAWLDACPVAALRLPAAVVASLADFDLRTVGQVRRLPRRQLPSRFGEDLLRRLGQADGTLAESVTPVLPVEPPSRAWRTDDPLRRADLVPVVLGRLIEELTAGLSEGVGVLKLAVSVAAGRQDVRVDVATARPTRCARRLGDLLALRLERVTLPRDVDRVRVEATSLDLVTRVQTDLFGDPLEGGRDRKFDDLVEQLTGRLGEGRVTYPEPTRQPLPERAVRHTPAVGGRPGRQTGAARGGLFTRPIRLLERPQPLRVWAVGRRPRKVESHGRTHEVAHVWGPERIETGWWEDAGEQRRDYYQVELESGDCLWMFRTPGSPDWLLHGVF